MQQTVEFPEKSGRLGWATLRHAWVRESLDDEFGDRKAWVILCLLLLAFLLFLALAWGLLRIENRVSERVDATLKDTGYSEAVQASVKAHGRDVSVAQVVGDEAGRKLEAEIEAVPGVRWARVKSAESDVSAIGSGAQAPQGSEVAGDTSAAAISPARKAAATAAALAGSATTLGTSERGKKADGSTAATTDGVVSPAAPELSSAAGETTPPADKLGEGASMDELVTAAASLGAAAVPTSTSTPTPKETATGTPAGVTAELAADSGQRESSVASQADQAESQVSPAGQGQTQGVIQAVPPATAQSTIQTGDPVAGQDLEQSSAQAQLDMQQSAHREDAADSTQVTQVGQSGQSTGAGQSSVEISALEFITHFNFSLRGQPLFTPAGNANAGQINTRFSERLNEMAAMMQASPGWLLTIVGNRDFSGVEQADRTTGIQRALLVMDALHRRGVDTACMQVVPLPWGVAYKPDTQIVFYLTR